MYLWRALPASQGATADARLRRGLGLDAGEPVLGRGEVVWHDCHQLVLRHLLTRAAAEETPLTATAVVGSSSDTIPLDEGDIFSSKTRMAEPMRARSIALRTCVRTEGGA